MVMSLLVQNNLHWLISSWWVDHSTVNLMEEGVLVKWLSAKCPSANRLILVVTHQWIEKHFADWHLADTWSVYQIIRGLWVCWWNDCQLNFLQPIDSSWWLCIFWLKNLSPTDIWLTCRPIECQHDESKKGKWSNDCLPNVHQPYWWLHISWLKNILPTDIWSTC